jgi:CRP/FNR family cyclic AMP-dependent transcriptional regulator
MWYETPMTTITLEQIITFLLEAPMFGDLDPGQLSEVVHIMQVRRVRDGQPIFREGDPGDAWYVIFEGGADVTKNNDFGPPKVISQIGPRACFGEMAILDHSPRSATVVARGETTVFRFPRDAFEALLAEDNLAAYKLVYQIAKVLTVRARNTTQQLADALADRAAPQRLRDTSTSLVEGQSLSE